MSSMNETTAEGPGNSTVQRSSYWSEGTVLSGNYRVVRRLGQGGMGTVYLVERYPARFPLRFAVKTMIPEIAGHPKRRRNFLRELHTWIDLPDHPNLVACRFFRTINGVLAVFAEYVDGMSLNHWIPSNIGAPVETLLDIAVQVARGLHCAHSHAVVHQDVKPANIMIARDGIAKITDFGLAQSRRTHRKNDGIDVNPNITDTSPTDSSLHPKHADTMAVTYGGMTLAYCSPEQAQGRKITRRTDIWSFGLTVLAMFNGGCTWQLGSLGEELLDAYLASGPAEKMPEMPDSVIAIVRDCIREDPDQRPDHMESIARRLSEAYTEITGQPYPRKEPETISQEPMPESRRERSTSEGSRWRDPAGILRRGLEHAGRPAAIIDKIVADARRKRPSGRKARAVHDIEVFEQAERVYKTLLKAGRDELISETASLLLEKALALESCHDYELASVQYERATRLLENASGRPERELMAQIALNHAGCLYYEGKINTSLDVIDRAISLYRSLVQTQFSPEHAARLANAVMNRAVTLLNLGKIRESLPFFEAALTDCEDLVRRFSTDYHWSMLGFVYCHYGESMRILGNLDSAGDMINQAMDIFQVQTDKINTYEAAYCLGFLMISKSRLLRAQGHMRSAMQLLNKTVHFIEQQLNEEKRYDMRVLLGDALFRRFEGHVVQNDISAAIADIEQSNAVFETLIHREGLNEYTPHSAAVRLIGAALIDVSGDPKRGDEWKRHAVELWRQLLQADTRRPTVTLPLRDAFEGIPVNTDPENIPGRALLQGIAGRLKSILTEIPALDWNTDFANLHRETDGI